jgi:ubiquitin-conjugating enzyme (huntingtin interacting protein 2)
MFRQTARHWTYVYATNRSESNKQIFKEFDSKIRRLIDIFDGHIDEHKAIVALSSNNWDLEKATQALLP